MPLDFPILTHNLQLARDLSREIVAENQISFTPKTIWDDHILRMVQYLETREAKNLLKRFRMPVASPYIENLIRNSLRLGKQQKIRDQEMKESVVSALLCPLRQIVGSCFATAPAIFIQHEQPERLLLDLFDLIIFGKMKRIFAGEEFVVPISPKWGNRKNDHALLRAWEYTLASFSDYKTTFSSWNMYQSLGLDPKIKGGIGHLLFQTIQKKVDESNKEVEKLHEDYARAVDEARVSQALLRQADSPERIRMRKGELDVRADHVQVTQDMRDEAYEKGRALSQLFVFMIEHYTQKFQEYFLEIFDADIDEKNAELYEDSPAGFRLCYKHGRQDPSTWTVIYNQSEFISSLRDFFLAVEPDLKGAIEWKGGEEEIEALTTTIIHFLDTKAFLSFALKEKTPWSYTSGGSMHTLLKGYYCIEGEVQEEKRPIESPTDLLTFLLELLKALPYPVTKPFEIDPSASLLMYSPTHAFLLKPGLSPFKEGWLDKGFTYTWIRDQVIEPGRQVFEKVRLDRDGQNLIGMKIFGGDFHPYGESLNLPDFRAYLVEKGPDKQDIIDSLLFQTFRPPKPLIFADTNWADYLFAFAINPATLELDLYRVSTDGFRMIPMTPWREYLDGTTSAPWGVLTRPSDLTGGPLSDIALKLRRV